MEESASLAELVLIPRLEYNCIYFKDKAGPRQRPVIMYLVRSAGELDSLDKAYGISKTCTQVNTELIRRRLMRPMSRDRYILICTKLDVAVSVQEDRAPLSQMVCLGKQFISPRRGLTFTRFRRKLPVELTPPMTMLPLFNSWLAAHAKPIT